MVWQPAASLANIKARAALYAQIRAFFSARGVLEVETPVMNRSTASEPQLHSVVAQVTGGTGPEKCYLQTSPEYPMKRLLAAGSGPIYQICKTFRDGELGRRHNPEFTMLEWYRPGFELDDLMREVSDLVGSITGLPEPEVLSYREVFLKTLEIDPFAASLRSLNCLARDVAAYGGEHLDRDAALDVLMACVIEPELGKDRPVFLTGYPPSQASLARLIKDERGEEVAARFELYINGIELANGYWELCDAVEQKARFVADNAQRQAEGQEVIPLDRKLLDALTAGLPESSGVALGLDRLLMVKLGVQTIDEVLCFPFDRV